MTLQIGLLLVSCMVIVSITGLYIARRIIKTSELKLQHDITDPYSQFVAMLFAVLLGFMVADAMQRFSQARMTVQQEASALGNVYRLADGISETQRDALRSLCEEYAHKVIEDEWPKLARKQDSIETWNVYRKLWSACTTFEPTNERQSNAQSELLSAMSSIGENRRLRIEALHAGLPLELWFVLGLGGAATIFFTYFFSAESGRTQATMVAIVSLVISLNLFLLLTYDDPFSGDVMVTPSAFETQLHLYSLD
ncbi:MAG: DUF4239 domain-containing protein [Candidatus Obscuribacterales bacterium]|nr:DUF4239 domain-containing protein [Candidatus Obscuribacterales bacterium]